MAALKTLNKIFTYKNVRKRSFLLNLFGGLVAFSSIFFYNPTVCFFLTMALPATIILSIVIRHKYFRCPYCREFLGWRTPNNIEHCPYCGKHLSLL